MCRTNNDTTRDAKVTTIQDYVMTLKCATARVHDVLWLILVFEFLFNPKNLVSINAINSSNAAL
jgi:hypothetical protein